MIDDAVKAVRASSRDDRRPWLVLGKGPSLALRVGVDLACYRTLALNHACRVHPCTLAHFTDLEAFRACRDYLLDNATRALLPYVPHVVLPWVPHEDMGPGHYNLSELVDQGLEPALGSLARRNLLWSYNSTRVSRARHHPKLTVVPVRYFSAVAAVNILALAGEREVFTLGVDGGRGYAPGFDPADRLANGRDSFDVQFAEIDRTVRRHKIRYVNLGKELKG
jgi:hypothetical protein